MTHRELPRDEWDRLETTDLGPLVPMLPADFRIFVVELDGQIVGHWGLFPAVHCEGVWVHPDHRGSGAVARHLLAAMRPAVEAAGHGGAWTGAQSPDVGALLERLHARRVPYDTYFWPCDPSKSVTLSED